MVDKDKQTSKLDQLKKAHSMEVGDAAKKEKKEQPMKAENLANAAEETRKMLQQKMNPPNSAEMPKSVLVQKSEPAS